MKEKSKKYIFFYILFFLMFATNYFVASLNSNIDKLSKTIFFCLIIDLNYIIFGVGKNKFLKISIGIFGTITIGLVIRYLKFFDSGLDIKKIFALMLFINTLFTCFDNIISSLFEADSLTEIFSVFLIIVNVYTFERNSLIFGNKITQTEILGISFVALGIYLLMLFFKTDDFKRKKIDFLQSISGLNKVEAVFTALVYSLIIYLSKLSTPKTHFVLFIFVLFYAYKDKIKLSKMQKWILIISVISIIFTISNYLLAKSKLHISLDKSFYKNVIVGSIILISFTVKSLEIKKLKKMIAIIASIAIVPSVFNIIMWIENSFKPGRYALNHVVIYGLMLSIILTVFVYSIIYLKMIYILPITISLMLSLLLTGTRNGIISIFSITLIMVISAVFIYKKKNILYYAGLLIVFIVTFAMVPGLRNRLFSSSRDTSAMSRIYIVKNAIKQFEKSPIYGNGYGTYRNLIDSKEIIKDPKNFQDQVKNTAHIAEHSHNNIISTLRSTGIIGLFIYLAINISIFLYFIAKFIKTKDNLYLLPIFMYVCLEIAGLADVTLNFGPKYQYLYYIFVGTLINYSLTAKEK